MILGIPRPMFRTRFCVLRRAGFQAPIPAMVCRYRRSRGYGSPGFFLEIRLSLLTKCTRTGKGPLRQRVMLTLYRIICEWRFENGEALPLYSRYYHCYCWSMVQCLRHSSLCISYFWTLPLYRFLTSTSSGCFSSFIRCWWSLNFFFLPKVWNVTVLWIRKGCWSDYEVFVSKDWIEIKCRYFL